MDIEVWKDIDGYNGVYQVSNLGVVRSLKFNKHKMLKPSNSNGYYTVILWKESKTKSYSIHQLVAMAFLDHVPCSWSLVIDHINGNTFDNWVGNLRILTQRGNTYTHHKGTSKYKGVSWSKRSNKWRSRIFIDGKNKHLGFYTDELEASQAYQAKLSSL